MLKNGPKFTYMYIVHVHNDPQTTSIWLYTTPTDPDTSISTSLRSLLDAEGLMGVATRDVVLVARGGSQMYGLALPTSDTDYIIVYKEPSEVGVAYY